MNHELFNKHVKALILFLMCLFPPVAFAQQPPQPCHITITGDFESQCILPLEKDDFYNEDPETIIACQENVVTYTASTNTGGVAVSQWSWSVTGATTWTDNGNGSITVTWGTGSTGQLVVSITTANGFSCSLTQNVKLIEKPTIHVVTTPAYVEMPNGDKYIYVCKGETIEFSDFSSTTNTDLVGYYWESGFYGLTASTQNFRIEDVWHEDEVIHRVYNNCGCYDEEHYIIKILEGEILDLSCYGTVCQDAVVTYSAYNPSCDRYSWYVEGGTIIEGQDQPKVTVHWNNPQNGYGIIALDGNLCGNNACPIMLSKKIPIIEDNIAITGQDIACVDEAVIYSIPLFGSTEYHWSITPSSGVNQVAVNGANEQMYIFTTPGTYQITVSYKCDFLECGEFLSEPLTVVVKPKLSITGEDRICVSNACDLRTEPNVSAIWRVLDLNNSQTIHSTNGTAFSWVFPHAGKYQITAENSNYCRPAVFIITVLNAPPAPTINDMDPNNPTVACLNSAILLKANPTNPDYSIIWQPSCEEGSPETVPGNEVTISYGNDVCDVYAYNYDPVLGCVSSDYYIHPVSEFQLAELDLPDNITVCPGTILTWTNANVPYQDKVIYEWQLEELKQYCASVQGDIFSNTISFHINELLPPHVYPTTFTLSLSRTYCSDLKSVHTITITISDNLSSTLSIDPIAPLCVGEITQLVGYGCNDDEYQWNVYLDNNTYTGNSVNYAFAHSGNINVTLSCNPYDVCDNSDYFSHSTINVQVAPLPPVEHLGYDGTNVYTVPALTSGYNFTWSHTNTNSCTVPAISGITTYTCTIANQSSPFCSVTKTITIDTNVDHCNSLTIVPNPGIDYCSKEIHLQLVNYPHRMFDWTVSGGSYGTLGYGGQYNQTLSIPVSDVGFYYISAYNNDTPCYSGTIAYLVDFLYNFTFEKACDKIIIHNNSKYLDGNKTIVLSVNGTSLPPITTGTPTQVFNTGIGGTFTFRLESYDGHNLNCFLETVTINNSSGGSLTIAAGNTTTCNNTPILFTASPATNDVYWTFGDGSADISANNTIFHTFEQGGPYTVTATVYNLNGCPSYGSSIISSFPNTLKPELLITQNDTIVCPGIARAIQYSFIPPYPIVQYDWSTFPSTPLNPPTFNNINHKNVYFTGDYSVEVSNNNYCRAKASRNVEFLNKPTAIIVTASSVYCVGEKIKFYGAPEPDTTSYTFDWTITDSSTGQMQQFHNASFSYTPSHVGAYYISFCITNNATDCSDCTNDTIRVNPIPPAPSISYGSNMCIDNPPVELTGSSTATSYFNWSNGNTGTNAYYFTPGVATAWYYDPNTGCKSNEANIHIEPEPNFDALLTGCYEKCEAFFRNNPHLPVWGLTSGRKDIFWKWYFNTNNIDGGILSYPNYYLSLPLPNYGDYDLHLDYNGGACGTLKSPTLTINPKEMCDCEGLDVSYKYEWWIEECKVYYKIDVTVCNNSDIKDCVSRLEQLFGQPYMEMVYTDFTYTTLNPGECYTFNMTVVASQLYPSSTIAFRIYDDCTPCAVDFSIDLMPEKIGCETDMQPEWFEIRPDLSSNVAAYFDFHMNVHPCQNVLAFWTEPPMIIDYWYDGADYVYGLGMVDFATLTQLMAEDSSVCFYAITCEGDQLCKRMYCIPAKDIYLMLQDMGIAKNNPAGSGTKSDAKQQASPELGDSTDPQLMPNPTTGEVNVIGTADKVVEVLVMDMNGRKMATFDNTSNFNISTLSSGIYIVRVKTHRDNTEKITYLKLVKK